MPESRPFNRNDDGPKAYRYEWETPDSRPVIVYLWPAFRDLIEQATYEAAVAGNPRREDEGPFAYAARISGIVTDEEKAR